ncbi:hypothetical protein J6590_058247 [Homalodisca vitripennis]|nr:hypothetical protein J6590_058247 [Homalodisca vitripennis]
MSDLNTLVSHVKQLTYTRDGLFSGRIVPNERGHTRSQLLLRCLSNETCRSVMELHLTYLEVFVYKT